MIINIVRRQKQEKENLLSLKYVRRSKIDFARKLLNSSLIKVIIGPRRAGKSVFSLMLLKNQPFMYFNFDDELVVGNKECNTDLLMKNLHGEYGDIKTVLFDEIQNLPNWELFINRLQREKYNLIITGSNANLLSKELSTALTGRHIPIEILPFNFNEFLTAKQFQIDEKSLSLPQKNGQLLHFTEQYLTEGGFPEIAVNKIDLNNYLSILFDSLIFKDVVKRHKVKLASQMDNLSTYLINNFGNLYTLRRLVNNLGFRSGVTVEKYLGYLQNAYIIYSLNRFSFKTISTIKSPRKIYSVDNGLISAKAIQHSPDRGKLMENLVFTELLKRGYQYNREIFYYTTRNNREVDFIIKKNNKVNALIQSVYHIADKDVEKREVKALEEASEELKTNKLTIITWDQKKQIKYKEKTINLIPLWQWLIYD